ncbi:MAG: TVP38/TMEM64 family protein [Ignavibacteria bacterium]|nr:TVP38/TMEM64 family protein [Ignavibacteria bacterium]
MNRVAKSGLAFAVLFILLIVYLQSGVQDEASLARLREIGANPYSAIIIVAAMTGAWLYALPASIFFFVTPLLFAPLQTTVIVCIGSLTGSAAGYWGARFVGGPWFEKFREHRITKFLQRHSSFASLFAIRVFPSSPHGFINYGAGLLQISFVKFILATVIGVGIKAYLYANAIEGSVGAKSILDALNWQTVSALSALGILAIIGHIVRQRWKRMDENLER